MKLELQSTEQELIAKFQNLETKEDVAQLLEIDPGTLIYHLYKIQPLKKYKIFKIPKI